MQICQYASRPETQCCPWWHHQMETFSALLAICAGTKAQRHKGQWRGALMFSLIYLWINGWVNNREPGDLRRHRTHYDVTEIVGICGELSLASTSPYSAPCTASLEFIETERKWSQIWRLLFQTHLRDIPNIVLLWLRSVPKGPIKWRLGAELATNHYLNILWLSSLTDICITWPGWVKGLLCTIRYCIQSNNDKGRTNIGH